MRAALLLLLLPLLSFGQDTAPMPRPELHFSPRGGVTEADVNLIDSAKETVRVMAYAFNSEPVAHALVEAHKRGVDVKVILDGHWEVNASRGKALLEAGGVPVLIDRAEKIQHNKLILVDGKKIRTGSANFTTEGDSRHAENTVILENRSLAARYSGYWAIHAAHSSASGLMMAPAPDRKPTAGEIGMAMLAPNLAPISDGTPNGYVYLQRGDWTVEFTLNGIAYRLTIPDGFVSDGTSVPHWAISMAGIDRDGLERRGAWTHDYLYKKGGVCATMREQHGGAWSASNTVFNRKDADDIFKILMLGSGVTALRAEEMHEAVRMFGGSSWRGK